MCVYVCESVCVRESEGGREIVRVCVCVCVCSSDKVRGSGNERQAERERAGENVCKGVREGVCVCVYETE